MILRFLSHISIIILKGTVSVISSDPQCKDGNARITSVPLKGLSDRVQVR